MSSVAHDWVARHAEAQPDAVALSSHDGGPTLTWADLDARVGGVAHSLHQLFGVGRGDRVTAVADNDPRMFELQFAAWRLGAVFAPLNWRLARPELHALCADCEPTVVVHDGRWAELGVELAQNFTGGARLAWGGVTEAHGGEDYDECALQADAAVPAGDRVSTDDLAQIVYTSGTTGKPKGAMTTHGALRGQAIALAHSTGLAEPGCHHFNPMPLFHAGGLNVLANPTLYWGGRVSTMARMVPADLIATLGDPRHGITHLAGYPTMCELMAAEPGFVDADLRAIRHVVLAAGRISPELAQIWHDKGATIQPQYGGTEMGPTALVLEDDDLERVQAGSVGRAAFHTDVRLVDEDGDDVPVGTVGEIWLRGESVTAGYWRQPREDYFTGDWFRTGDSGRRDADGHHYVVGRTKEMYKSGAENVYPAEVENALANAPGVAEIVVVGVPDPTWDEVGLAAVVPCDGVHVSLEGLRAFGSARIARFKLPRHLVLVDELPRNATGKVSRTDLRERFLERTRRRAQAET